jgi:hypothetical protein
MDSGASEPRDRPRPPADREYSEAPRGRSAGVDKDLVVSCKKCSTRITGVETVGPEDRCPKCAAPLRSCSQCRSFDSGSPLECLENAKIPARIADKNGANTCPVYTPALSFDMTGRKPTGAPSDARRAFDDLFKK